MFTEWKILSLPIVTKLHFSTFKCWSLLQRNNYWASAVGNVTTFLWRISNFLTYYLLIKFTGVRNAHQHVQTGLCQIVSRISGDALQTHASVYCFPLKSVLLRRLRKIPLFINGIYSSEITYKWTSNLQQWNM
jgi:hypothetical protein